jgi:hypothetical protein
MIPEKIMEKLYSDFVKQDFISFLSSYHDKIEENEFSKLFLGFHKTFIEETDARIKILFPQFVYSTNLQQLGETIFQIEIKKKNIDMFYKTQFSGMMLVISKYYSEIQKFTEKENFYENDEFCGMMEYYKYLIIDAIILIADCERLHGIKPIRDMRYTHMIKSDESFTSSLKLKIDLKTWSELSSFNASVFLIRQSIELKIKNALDINFIVDRNGRMLKIPGDKLMGFFFKNKNIELQNIKKSIIRKIHSWTQYFVHGGYVLNIWQIDIAHSLIKPLFFSDSGNGMINKYDNVKIHKDYYNGQFKSDLEKYIEINLVMHSRNGLINIIKFIIEYIKFFITHKKSFEIVYLNNPEACIY